MRFYLVQPKYIRPRLQSSPLGHKLYSGKGEGKVANCRHIGEWRYSSTHSLTSALDGDE
jgi:hypothetical protein